MKDELDDVIEADGLREAVDARVRVLLFARQMRKRRESKGLTQRQVAEAMGTSQASVSQLERGRDVSFSTLARYLEAIGVEDWSERLAGK